MKARLFLAVCAPKTGSLLAVAVVHALKNRGIDAENVVDGDARGLEAANLLLMGSVGSLRRYRRVLRRGVKEKPNVMVWNVEPLPPVELQPWAERLGMAFTTSRLGINRAKPVLQFLTHPIYAIISRFGLGQFSRGRGVHPVKSQCIRFLIETFAYLSLGLQQGWIDAVCSSTPQMVAFLRSRRINSEFVPVGQREFFGRDIALKRDIDVLFVGRIKRNPARRFKLRRMVELLEARGFRVEVHTKGLAGETRLNVVNRSKIVLHLHNVPWDTPLMRWYLASACGALVVSETLNMADPFVPGEHFLSGDFEQLPDIIDEILNDEPRRLALVTACKKRIEEELTLEISLDRLLKLCAGNRQSKVPA